jgi:hypothetical protein
MHLNEEEQETTPLPALRREGRGEGLWFQKKRFTIYRFCAFQPWGMS